MKRLLVPLAAGMAALYVVLALGAVGCPFLHDQSPASHHHTQSHVHSALCAWACQVNPTVATVSSAPTVTMLAVVSSAGLFEPTLVADDAATVSPSRAPPRFL